MNKAKVAYHNEPTATLEPQENYVELRIDGLKELEPGLFRLLGAKQRYVNWDALREAIHEADEDLMAAVERAILKHDMVKLLTERVRC